LRQKSLHSLEHDGRWVSDLGRHRKLAGVNARDVHEVSHQAGHPSGRALNTPSAHPHLLLGMVPRHDFRDEFRGAADRVQHVPEVMADDAQKFISRGKRVVGPSAHGPTHGRRVSRPGGFVVVRSPAVPNAASIAAH
jgi:hypothetical protein